VRWQRVEVSATANTNIVSQWAKQNCRLDFLALARAARVGRNGLSHDNTDLKAIITAFSRRPVRFFVL
jgi:hypothetical protein